MLTKYVSRGFTTNAKHPKGSIGKEGTLGNNFSFPRHKELFNEGYYDDDPDSGVNSEDHFESKFSKQMES